MRCELDKQFFSQNTRGLNDDKEEELLDFMRINNIFASGIQETWRPGIGAPSIHDNNGYVVVHHGREQKRRKKGRFSGGVAIVLSPDAKKAWNSANSQTFHFGDRILAIRMHIPDEKKRLVKIFFVVAYFPIGAASPSMRQEFYLQFEQCITSCLADEVLLIAADTNSSMGTRSNARDGVLGPFGVKYCNKAGQELYDCCATLGLCSATTFFQKSQYQTWMNPRSKLGHQIDHFLVRKVDFARIRDAGRFGGLCVESDHQPIRLTLRVAKKLCKQRLKHKEAFLDRQLLQQPDVRSQFQQEFISSLRHSCTEPNYSYDDMVMSLTSAATKVLSVSERPRNDWFHLHQASLRSAIQERNLAQRAYNKALKPNVSKPLKELAQLRARRKAVKKEVKKAKEKWMIGNIKLLHGAKENPKGFWEGIYKLKAGLTGHIKKHIIQLFKNTEGKLCENAAENSKALETHYEKVYNIGSNVDASVIDEVRQRPVCTDLDCAPSDKEISKALQQAKKNKAVGDSKIPVEFWQALEGNDETETLFKDYIRSFWENESPPKDWLVNRLRLIPKKGDPHDLNNWRGIMLMEAAPKLVSSIIAARIKKFILVEEGLEEQNGFMPNRGCRDGIFSLKLALQKRREHGLGTWAVFVDLVKAFDSVPREAMYSVLDKFGIPPKMKRIIMKLHSGLIVKIQAGNSDVEIGSTCGVKQGCTMAPILFLIYMQAAVEVFNVTSKHCKLQFKTREDNVFSGRNIRTRKDVVSFEISSSLYADDGAFLFESRSDLHQGMELIFRSFKRFGLICHVGRGGAKSKTEAMYFPPPQQLYQDANTLPLEIDGGCVTFTQSFKYLGSVLTSDLDDSTEVEARIKSASAAFASMRSQLFSSRYVKPAHKAQTYESIVLGLLLYGSETWSLTEKLKIRLRSFHHRCVRAMCRINLWHTQQYHISENELETRLGLKSLDTYLMQRRLNWAGHVYRMDFNRLPRKLLSSWVDHPRPRGRPQAHYGHGLARDLKKVGLNTSTWHEMAANRPAWLELLQNIGQSKPSQDPPTLPKDPSSSDLPTTTRLSTPPTPPLPPTPPPPAPPTAPPPPPIFLTRLPGTPPTLLCSPAPPRRCSTRPSAIRARQEGYFCTMAGQLRRQSQPTNA